MTPASGHCDLCGLPISSSAPLSSIPGETDRFCCLGCKQVFRMLAALPGEKNPAVFSETALFKKCQAAGIIPDSATDGKRQLRETGAASLAPSPGAEKNYLTFSMKVEGMWCPACAWVIEETLKRLPGIEQVSCSFSTDRIRCTYDPIFTSPADLYRVIDDLGYHGLPVETLAADSRKKKELLRLIVSAGLSLNIMMLSFALYTGFVADLYPAAIAKLSWPLFAMATIVVFYGGKNIYRKAWAGITRAAPGMEVLISVGVFSAYVLSIFNLAIGSLHLYFDTAAMLITLVLVGKMLESGAKKRIAEDIAGVRSLKPTKARMVSADHPAGVYVSADRLHPDDVFLMEDSEVLPADGRILDGSGTVDESSLTGEARPVSKRPGDLLRSGTQVIHGHFSVRTTAAGNDATLGQMIRIMERALEEKTPLEGKTDRLLRWFVPVILLLALGTALAGIYNGLTIEMALIRAITVLIIACPCSLGIAIPLARVGGISVAHRKGILVRNPLAFEQASGIGVVVFDKTGTITHGRWTLRDIISIAPFTRDRNLSLAVSLEESSDHPIAVAIRQAAEELSDRSIIPDKIDRFENGISGQFGKDEVKIGSRDFLKDEIAAAGNLPDSPDVQDDTGYSSVYMSFGGRLCGIMLFGDKVRESAPAAIRALEATGCRTVLVSGDGIATTRTIGDKIGVADASGEKLPREKVAVVRAMQQKGFRVAMVGDGINDAPALAQADLSVAIHSGSHLTRETADITLMGNDLMQILAFRVLAKAVSGKVHQNLVWAFLYNLVSIPMAMAGLLTPLIAVSAMLLSSLSVIGNTVLLVRKSSL